MTIKDVEKITGLTAKSIRYYEDKGLLKVERNEENSYRSYSEANVERLKWIKLLRYLEFSIEEIQEILSAANSEAAELLYKKAEEFQDKTEDYKTKKDMCAALGKEYGKNESILEKYEEQIEFYESEDYEEIKEMVKDASVISTPQIIISSLIFAAPIIMLFINIYRGFEAALMLNAVFATVSTVMLVINWRNYLCNRRIYKKIFEKKNKNDWYTIPLMVLLLIAMLACFAGLHYLIILTMAPEGWLFYQMNVHTEYLLLASMVFMLGMLFIWLFKNVFHVNSENLEYTLIPWEIFEKFKTPIIVVWLVLVYIGITSITFVTEDKIICHSPLNPMGTVYEYEDVDKVEVDFGSKSFAIFEYKRKGSFNYTIHMGDKEVIFHTPSINEDIERYVENSYLELEELDETLVNIGVEKESTTKYSDHCDFDQEFIDRFIRIAENN